MAFRSIAQMQKFEQLVREGKMSKQTFDEWSKGTDTTLLPQRVNKYTPKLTEHVHIQHRHKRKQRKKRIMKSKPKQRTKRKQPIKRKQRTLPL